MAEEQSYIRISRFSLISTCVTLMWLFQMCQASGLQCGSVKVNLTGFGFRVKDGTPTPPGAWPFIAALFWNDESKFICGGTLISPRHVLTAAHCIRPKGSGQDKSNIEVRLGAHNLTANEANVEKRNVTEYYIHDDWNALGTSYDADVAVLVLSHTVTYTNFIQPVCIPAESTVYIGALINVMGTIVGWGFNERKDFHEEIPLEANMQALNDSYCYRGNIGIAALSSDRTFCAHGKGAPTKGDSGGGFFVDSDKGYVQYGIISALQTDDKGEITSDRFSIYGNVRSFKSWIEEKITRIGDISIDRSDATNVGSQDEIRIKINLNCDYRYITIFGSREYACLINDLDTQSENIDVTSFTGTHLDGKSDIDVRHMRILNGMATFLPNGIGNTFRILKSLGVRRDNLTSLSLKRIKKSNFVNLDDLVDVILYGNDIEVVDEDSLMDLPNLENFQLTYNKLKALHETTFENNEKLRVVNVRSNQLETLPNLFQKNPLLEEINFTNNSIKTIDEQAFSRNTRLTLVYLSENQLEFLPKNLFQNNLLLKNIYLFNNLIKTIDEHTFATNTNLRRVDLKSNQLEFLPRDLFKNNFLLEFVQLDYNSLKTIETDFSGLVNLRMIYLYKNVCTDSLYYNVIGDNNSYRNHTRNLREFQNLIVANCSNK